MRERRAQHAQRRHISPAFIAVLFLLLAIIFSSAPRVRADVVTISADFDGDVKSNLQCDTTFSALRVAGAGNYYAFLRFPLSLLPSGATVTDVDLHINVVDPGDKSIDVQAYNLDGQADPGTDTCADRRTRSGNDTTPYLDEQNIFETTGAKSLQLPAAANTDIEAAKSAVDRFSIGINFGASSGGRGDIAAIENSGTAEAQLVITYTVGGGNNAPTIAGTGCSGAAFSDAPDPVTEGGDVTFCADWNDADSDQVKVHFCKTNAITASSTGGSCPGGTWASSAALTTTDPKNETYTTQAVDVGTNNYYVFVCDDDATTPLCSGTSGNSGTFTTTAPGTVRAFGDTFSSATTPGIVWQTPGELTRTTDGSGPDEVVLDSLTLDTGTANGAGFNSVLWRGVLGSGKVGIQLATSNCANGASNPPVCTSGTWGATGSNYFGPGCTNAQWYEPAPDVPAEIVFCPATPHDNPWNKRYFRYRVRLCLDTTCTTNTGGTSPRVDEVVINWSR